MHACNQRMAQLLSDADVKLDAIYFCPHAPDQTCDCRKPLPGMIHQAQKQFWFEPSRSFVVGDNEPDIGLARSVGGTAILLTTGHGAAALAKLKHPADFVADDFLTAAKWIVSRLDIRC
jgi:D-glycero-D-manno-heptose 1,7-bisphosphate phosphatase